jgi:hypothetical protein
MISTEISAGNKTDEVQEVRNAVPDTIEPMNFCFFTKYNQTDNKMKNISAVSRNKVVL